MTKRSSCSILPCHKLHRMIVLFEVNYQAAFTGTSLINSKCPSRHQNNAPTTDCDFSPTWLHTHQVPLPDSRCHPPEHWHQEVQWTEDVVCVGGEGDLQESEEKVQWHPKAALPKGRFWDSSYSLTSWHINQCVPTLPWAIHRAVYRQSVWDFRNTGDVTVVQVSVVVGEEVKPWKDSSMRNGRESPLCTTFMRPELP